MAKETCRVIAVAIQKGGVGKSTISTNLAYTLSRLGKTVLLIDIDAQANATNSFGYTDHDFEGRCIENVMRGKATLAKSIQSVRDNFYLVPASHQLRGLVSDLTGKPNSDFILKKEVDTVLDYFDYIFIDCPPDLGLLTRNALVAANEVLIPWKPGRPETQAVGALRDSIDTINAVLRSKESPLIVTGIIANMVMPRTTLHKAFIIEIQKYFPGLLFKNGFRHTTVIAESVAIGKMVMEHEPRHSIVAQYVNCAKELIRKKPERKRSENLVELVTKNEKTI